MSSDTLSSHKKSKSHITSEELEKIFKESDFCRSHFFPKEVPSLEVLDLSFDENSQPEKEPHTKHFKENHKI